MMMSDKAQGIRSDLTEECKLRLDVLKALHEASYNRWEKRRSYEWLLSYAIWGALGGFIATIFFGKDSKPTPPSALLLTVWLSVVVATHFLYLYFIVEGTLRDLRAQGVIERAMTRLAGGGRRLPLTPKRLSIVGRKHPFRFRNFRIRRFLVFWRPRHGLIGQVMITLILCQVAAWASMASSKPASPNHQSTAIEGTTSKSASGK
jgi:hypothetical protein